MRFVAVCRAKGVRNSYHRKYSRPVVTFCGRFCGEVSVQRERRKAALITFLVILKTEVAVVETSMWLYRD